MPRENIADVIATEIEQWIEEESDAVAEAILGSALAPAVVQPSRGEAVAYWRTQLFNQDGTPNPVGRSTVMARYGAQGYQDIALAVAGEPVPLEQYLPGGPTTAAPPPMKRVLAG